MQIRNEQIAFTGSTAATVKCTLFTVFQGQVGAVRNASVPTVFQLEKRNNVWYIVSRQ
jgi:hypothetical protein